MAGFNTAVTGLKSASQMLDVAGNNIANSSTVGFKSSRTEFADIYATSVVGAGSSNQPGSGVTVSDISQDFSAGTIEFTNNNLDLAINGSGFFQLNDGQGGITYTRAGTFELDKDGYIVSKNGKNLQGYGLDALGNQLPLQNLAVTQKESAPKATETIDLAFNIDSSADATELNRFFDKADPGSYTYSTTVETVDSLGNSNSIRFYVVEQRPVREQYQYDVSELSPATDAASSTIGSVASFTANLTTLDLDQALVELQQDFTLATGTPETFDITIDGLLDVNGDPVVGPISVTLNQNWSGAAPTPAQLQQVINDAINLQTDPGLTAADETYITVSADGSLTLDTDFGTNLTVETNALTEPSVTSFLGDTTRSGVVISGGARFDLTITDNAGTDIYTLPDIAISESWATNGDNAAAVAADIENAINNAIRADLGTTNQDYVSVDLNAAGTAYEITLVADEWVNSAATFTIDGFDGYGTDYLTLSAVLTGGDGTVDGALADSPESILISGVEFTFDELLTLPDSLLDNTVALANFRVTDPRIDPTTLSYNPETGILSFETFASATQQGDMVVVGRGDLQLDGTYANPTEVSLVGGATTERDSNKVEIFDLNDSLFSQNATTGVIETNASIQMTIGGIDITISDGLTKDDVGAILEGYERALIEKNPDIESVSYDRNAEQLTFTWKADAGDADPLVVTTPGASIFDGASPTRVTGDNTYQAQYRMYGFLNDTEQLNLGKVVDPGESGFENGLTEVGAVMVSFDPTTGTLATVNGSNAGSSAPRITILGADPANPNDELLDSDVDGLEGIQLDITGTTQFASESIVKSSAQDGYPKGDLIGVTFAETGEMVASFSNGQRQNLGLVAIASFENQAGLSSAGSTEWIATLASGAAILNPPGTGLNGTLRSAALESSNVDLSAELVKLIEAQRNFQANSKTLETQNTVTQAILQI